MLLENYIQTAKKQYEFKIGVAGELPEGFADNLEMALQKFKGTLTPGKKTPIQKRPLDFPQLDNVEITYYEATLDYPTTPQIMREYVGNCCGIDQSHVIVRNANEPQEQYQEDTEDDAYETRLETEDMGGDPKAQDEVGTSRVMSLLAELEKARNERDIDPVDGAPKGESKDIGDTENNKSVVGG